MKILFFTLAIVGVSAFYSSNDGIVQLTDSDFEKKVLQSNDVWLIEFYSPGCGHCRNLVPEYKKTSKALKGIIKVAAVDVSANQQTAGKYGITGVPSIKLFAKDFNKPKDFSGARDAASISKFVTGEVRKIIEARLGGKSKTTNEKKSNTKKKTSKAKKSDGPALVTLTDANFEEKVLNSNEIWLVEFFAPWCGHCQRLEPIWKEVAEELRDNVKVAALDATVHQNIAGQAGVQGYPTIKIYTPGSNSVSDGIPYEGGRDKDSILERAMQLLSEHGSPREVEELTAATQLTEACEHQLCLIVLLPHLYDCQSKCRNRHIEMINKLVNKFKKNDWRWLWMQGGSQIKLEETFEVDGLGYPNLVVFNQRKNVFATLKGSFDESGLSSFLRDIGGGRGRTVPRRDSTPPTVVESAPWDGKDLKMDQINDEL